MITEDDQMTIWNTSVLDEFNHLNFDNMLFESEIYGTETYINKGDKNKPCHVEGYEIIKKHKKCKIPKVYFMYFISCSTAFFKIVSAISQFPNTFPCGADLKNQILTLQTPKINQIIAAKAYKRDAIGE